MREIIKFIQNFNRKSVGKRLFGKYRRRCNDNIKTDVK